ncbi:hypothetical protein DOCECA_02345 [Pseudomonas sp. E102]
MHGCIYSQCVNAFIYAWQMHERMKPAETLRVASFQEAKKNPRGGGFYLTAEGLTGVHAPPEDVTEDDDLLVLHFLERVVLIRMFIAVEAAQTNASGQAV